MPDRTRGYVQRGKGILPTDTRMAERYCERQRESVVTFDASIQGTLIDECRVACGHQDVRCHAVATDTSHLHVLVSWRHDEAWDRVRTGMKSSLTRRLKADHGPRTWFSRGGSRKRVVDESHFEYLLRSYLPNHRGAFWSEPS